MHLLDWRHWNIRWFMASYAAGILALAAYDTGQFAYLIHVLGMIALYAGVDLAWTWIATRRAYVPLSSLISALIGSIVLNPQSPWWVLIAFPVVAALSKHIIRWEGKHVFNPAAFGLVAVALAYPQAITWWAVTWWNMPLKFIGLAVGVYILWRIRRVHMAAAFFAVYAAGQFIATVKFGLTPAFVLPLLFDGTVIFFTTVMLVEPKTTSYPSRRRRIAYGVIVALFVVLGPFVLLQPGLLSSLPDGFLPPLLIGNLLAATL